MERQSPVSQHYFSVEEANALVPFLEAIFSRVDTLVGDTVDLENLCIRADAPPATKEGWVRLAILQEELRDAVQAIEDYGVEVKRISPGLVDFPSRLNGRPTYLCWEVGEREVAHWHELDTGYTGRLPVRESEDFEPYCPH